MRKYGNIILNIYIIIKIVITFFAFFSPPIFVFGVSQFLFSIGLALDGGIKTQIAAVLFYGSSLWALLFIMNFFPFEKVRRIARFGIIVLSCLEILYLLISIVVLCFISYDFDFGYSIRSLSLRLAAIAENIWCIVYCIKLNSKNKVQDNLSLQSSTDSQE